MGLDRTDAFFIAFCVGVAVCLGILAYFVIDTLNPEKFHYEWISINGKKIYVAEAWNEQLHSKAFKAFSKEDFEYCEPCGVLFTNMPDKAVFHNPYNYTIYLTVLKQVSPDEYIAIKTIELKPNATYMFNRSVVVLETIEPLK